MISARKTHPVVLAALGYIALTLAYTWPLPRHLFDGVAHDLGDPVLNAWILWWSTKAVPLTAAWWNAPIFYPAPGTLAFSEHLVGLAPLTAPLIALSGSPLFGYNVALLASYVLCALSAYFLAFTLTRSHDASFVAGLAFAFAPYRLAQLPHIQVMTSFWTPLCLAALHRYDEEATSNAFAPGSFSGGGWAIAAAASWYMQAMSNGYFFFFLSLLIALWLAWFVPGRWPMKRLAGLAAAFLGAMLLFVPVLLGYSRILTGVYGFRRGYEAVAMYSADVASLLQASDDLLVWGWVHAVHKPESDLFPGVTVAALAVFAALAAKPFMQVARGPSARQWLRRSLGLLAAILLVAGLLPFLVGRAVLTIGGIRLVSVGRADTPLLLAVIASIAWLATMPAIAGAFRRRSALLFYGFAALATWVLALGPDPQFFGRTGLRHAPYTWLMQLPGVDGLRVPARFWTMSLVCLTVLAAHAIRHVPARRRKILVAIAAAGVLLDGWPKTFPVQAAPERRPTPTGVTLRLDLPMNDDRDVDALYQQTFDGIPTYNGYSGYAPPHQYAMRVLLDAADPRILHAMASRGPLGVVIDRASDTGGRMNALVAGYPEAAQQGDRPGWTSFRLPAGAPGDLLPDERGDVIPIKSLDAFPSAPHTPRAQDGDYHTRWSGGVQNTAADFTIEVERGHVGQVVTDLGEFSTDFPVKLRIEVSPDGTQWDTAFLGDTALHAYYAALRHPKAVPLVFPIERDNVRFIRLRQLGWGTHDWSIAEIRVRR